MCDGYYEGELSVAEVKWYARGDIGEALRDALDFYDNENCINKMQELGLSEEEIVEVLLMEEGIV